MLRYYPIVTTFINLTHIIYSMTNLDKEPQNYPYEKIKEKITNCTNPQAQSIAALAYASGARVSELNNIKKIDIQEREGYLRINCKVLKKRYKTKQNQTRIALVRLDETWLVEPIKRLSEGKQDEDILIPMYRMKIYRILTKHFGFNPHFFRALRATHLSQLGYSAHQLKHFFGWSSISPSDFYVGLNTEDLEY